MLCHERHSLVMFWLLCYSSRIFRSDAHVSEYFLIIWEILRINLFQYFRHILLHLYLNDDIHRDITALDEDMTNSGLLTNIKHKLIFPTIWIVLMFNQIEYKANYFIFQTLNFGDFRNKSYLSLYREMFEVFVNFWDAFKSFCYTITESKVNFSFTLNYFIN